MSSPEETTTFRPWWKEPMALAFGVLILAASAAVMCQGWAPPAKPVDSLGKTAIPGGGSFCDPVTPQQGTLENPSTQGKPSGKTPKPEFPNQ